MDAFDADVLVYAATDHPFGPKVRALLKSGDEAVGSVVLLPEVLSKPVRTSATREIEEVFDLLARLTLLPCDHAIAELAVALGASYKLRAADAVHLATAVNAGADRFVTNNRKDFRSGIEEIEIIYPDQL